jgi:transglutaminase-like putative cysteine protease
VKIALYRKIDPSQARPFLALYIVFFILSFLTINTYYLVFFEVHYRYYLWTALAIGYMISIYSEAKYRPYLDLAANVLALLFFVISFRQILGNIQSFGTILGQLLAILLVLRSGILFNRDDFFVPLTISLAIMLLCSIPSYESNYVLSLQAYFFVVVACLYMLTKTKQHEMTRFGFFETQKIRKLFTTKTELSMPVIYAFVALFVATVIYIAIPRPEGRNQRYINQLRSIFGDRFEHFNPQSESDEGGGATPLMPQGSPYAGFNEVSFRITRGREVLQGENANNIVMEVQMDYPSYMRALTWDTYENGEWKRSDNLEMDTELKMVNNPLMTISNEIPEYRLEPPPEITVDELRGNRVDNDGKVFIKTENPSTLLFLPWQATDIRIDSDDLVTNSVSEVRLIPARDAKNRIQKVSRYDFTSKIYLPAGMEKAYLRLRSDDPSLDIYRQLPESVTQPINGRTVKQMAEEIVQNAGAQTDYEKTVAILNYLKSVGKYSLSPPYIPSEFDVVSYFLLEVSPKRSHCEIFSSSMAIMLRSLGIPCRMATGYTSGSYSFNRNSFLVRERDAHAWVEVYFPEVGWLEFDPTPGSLFNDLNEQTKAIVASITTVINDLYVYSPRQFYQKKVSPLINRLVSLYYYNVGRVSDYLGRWFSMQSIMTFILVMVIAAGSLVVILQLRKPPDDFSAHKRVSRMYYRNLVDNLRRKGNSIAVGITPTELLEITKTRYPIISDTLELFIMDFHEFNYSRPDQRRELFKEMRNAYKVTLSSIKHIRH